MKISDFLTQLGNSVQGAPGGRISYTWEQALFLCDVLAYIGGEKPKYFLCDYLDGEGRVYREDLQSGYCKFRWATADEGSYGFRIREEYVYLPCYDDFLSELACRLYGSADISIQRQIREEIESMGFWNGKESLDMEGCLVDREIFKAMLSMYPDFFQFAGTGEGDLRILKELFLTVLRMGDGVTGTRDWKLLNLESPALDAWLGFLHFDTVSDQDRRGSMQILARLVDTRVTLETWNNELCMCSHESTSPCFERPYKGVDYVPFSLSVMQDAYGNYNYGYEAGFFWFGLVNPHFLSAMLDVREFLEKMDEKYHYFSSSDCEAVAGMDVLRARGGRDEK